jgi:hypothetical protein
MHGCDAVIQRGVKYSRRRRIFGKKSLFIGCSLSEVHLGQASSIVNWRGAMKESLRCLLVLVAAAIPGIGVPRVASADPVTITSGFISVPRVTFSPTELEGTDGVLPFSFMGFISSASGFGLRSCTPCSPTATTISLEIGSAGLDVPGTVTYGNDTYLVGGLDPEAVGAVVLHLTGFASLPPAPSTLNDLATVTGSFELVVNSRFSPPCCGKFGPGNELRGAGTATVSLGADPGAGVPVWAFRSAEYQFSSQAPIPEPASFVLLASGLIGVAVRRRRGR